ncbi:MAG: hypothetical protein Q8M20_14465 [Rhodocyclaceae bacterium]|nr:hypothetical protein [Rhodocyclaceae bacterium]MDZ4216204.1 hypothetical protein [Rhodocyclaceae bacterium]
MKYSRQIVWGLLLGLVVMGAWIIPLDKAATEHVDAGLKRALVSFASARALNAVISVAQGTEIAATPAGIGVQLSVGQILDPVNDVVEQFSQLMLAASIAFGIEKILISIGAYWMVSLVITAIAVMCAYYIFRQRPLPALLTKVLAMLIMVRFAVPLAIIGSDKMFHEFMADDYMSSQKSIETVSGQLPSMNDSAPQVAQEKSIWDKIKGWSTQNLDIRPQLTGLKEAAEQAIENAIRLMVIFLLQTLVLPLLLIWILWGMVKGMTVAPPMWPQLARPDA